MPTFEQLELDDYGLRIGLGNGKLLQYLDTYTDYYRNQYPLMVKFFSGELSSLKAEVFNNLTDLIRTAEDISNKTNQNDYLLPMYRDWEINDYLDDLKQELYRMTKTSKFLRSSKTNFDFKGVIEFNYLLAQNQTIEDAAFKILGSKNYDNDATDIAIRNDLEELDYDLKGGTNLILEVQLNSANSDIKSVVDNIIGKKVYGMDIKRTFNFVGDDLEVLDYDNTIIQAVDILSGLMKGQIPEFKTLGRTNIVGKSISFVSTPTLVREMTQIFSSDDTIANFTIKDLKNEGDSKVFSFSVNSRLELIIKQNINI